MKIEDLKKGVIYQFTWGTDPKISIGTVYEDGTDKLKKYIYKEGSYVNQKSKGGSTINRAIENCKPATNKQIRWLNACIKEDRFIRFNKIKISNNYPIY